MCQGEQSGKSASTRRLHWRKGNRVTELNVLVKYTELTKDANWPSVTQLRSWGLLLWFSYFRANLQASSLDLQCLRSLSVIAFYIWLSFWCLHQYNTCISVPKSVTTPVFRLTAHVEFYFFCSTIISLVSLVSLCGINFGWVWYRIRCVTSDDSSLSQKVRLSNYPMKNLNMFELYWPTVGSKHSRHSDDVFWCSQSSCDFRSVTSRLMMFVLEWNIWETDVHFHLLMTCNNAQ